MSNKVRICLCGEGEVAKILGNYLSSLGSFGGYEIQFNPIWSDVYDSGNKLTDCDIIINTLMADISHTFGGDSDSYSSMTMVKDSRVLFETAERTGCKVIHISRDYAFPPKFGMLIPSEDSTRGTPTTAYGTHLLFAESISEAFDNVKTLRISELYGSDVAWYSFVDSLISDGMQAFLPSSIFRTFLSSSAFCESVIKSVILFDSLPKFLNLGDGNRKSYYDFISDRTSKNKRELLVRTNDNVLKLGLRSKYAFGLGIG